MNSNADFARQVAERNRATNPQKKPRSSVPKGSKLAAGYVDRTRSRQEEDEREARLKALEESLRNEEIDRETFDRLCSEIAGGDLATTHMVKGLDFKLLQRVRGGEDVYQDGSFSTADKEARDSPAEAAEGDIDDELDRVLEQEVTAVEKEKREKKGQLSTVSSAAGKKRTRDQILADLKAARAAATTKEPKEDLGGKFKKIGAKQQPGTRIERDSRGREVLIIVDEDGHEKRKIRKVYAGEKGGDGLKNDLPMPDKDAKPLGMEVPEIYQKREEPEEEEDDDIFGGVGDDYDPLAGLAADSGSDSDSDSDSDGGESRPGRDDATRSAGSEKERTTKKKEDPAVPPAHATGPRNYFKDAKTGLISQEEVKAPSLSDPTIMAALKKAASLNPLGKGPGDDDDVSDQEERARLERRRKLLESTDRDAEDLDMGFGTSRFEDEEDFDERKVKLSKWGEDGGDGEGRSSGGRQKRKRGPKKRKGDGNNAADVLRVLEQRRAGGS